MVKRQGGATYVFAAAMRNGKARGEFTLRGLPKAARAAEVLGESRAIPVRDGAFGDDFAPHAVHLYRIPVS
jgi:hypothetical protein